MELGDSGWERRDFSRLLEQLWDSPGAPPQVLKYLGGCLAPTRIGEGGGAMSTTFGFASDGDGWGFRRPRDWRRLWGTRHPAPAGSERSAASAILAGQDSHDSNFNRCQRDGGSLEN